MVIAAPASPCGGGAQRRVSPPDRHGTQRYQLTEPEEWFDVSGSVCLVSAERRTCGEDQGT